MNQYKVFSHLTIMDLFAARDALAVVIRYTTTRETLHDWHKNADRENWYNPSGSSWKYPQCELPIVINENGEEVSPEEQRKAWWNKLLKESDINLIQEDQSASTITAAIKGLYTRRSIREMHRANLLSDIENYRFNECHGGC